MKERSLLLAGHEGINRIDLKYDKRWVRSSSSSSSSSRHSNAPLKKAAPAWLQVTSCALQQHHQHQLQLQQQQDS
jgi:hypothetical protein